MAEGIAVGAGVRSGVSAEGEDIRVSEITGVGCGSDCVGVGSTVGEGSGVGASTEVSIGFSAGTSVAIGSVAVEVWISDGSAVCADSSVCVGVGVTSWAKDSVAL